jgi:hypothetical protein
VLVFCPRSPLTSQKTSPSFRHTQTLLGKPLMLALGPLSRLISHAVEQVHDPAVFRAMVDRLSAFSKSLETQWRQTRLSDVDVHDEAKAFTDETLSITTPVLWRLLRSCLFSLVIVFRGFTARLIGDRLLAADAIAPAVVCQILRSLRSVYFISSRIGTSSFTQYNFVYLACVDILSAYPAHVEELMQSIRPDPINVIPASPVDRASSLYFLNTAEHFALSLPPPMLEVLVAAAGPYLSTATYPLLFEAAHSVVLAVLCVSHNTAALATSYADTLFGAFPRSLSPRQFRLAFKTLLRVMLPPSALAASDPNLVSALLELLRYRAEHASQALITAADANATPASEQSTLTLAALDVLPLFPRRLLDEWLPLAANLVQRVPAGPTQEECRAKLWQIVSDGELDPDRALVSFAWWSGGQPQSQL